MSVTNSFGTFLQTKNLLRGRTDRVEALGRTPIDPGAEMVAPRHGMTLLGKSQFPVKLEVLRADSDLRYADFAEALSWLSRAGLVEIQDDEVVALTEKGSILLED